MDIGSGNGYPSANLSNFTPRSFIFDGVKCCSIEGVLQSFKFKDELMQQHVCTLVGKAAKFKGKKKKWWKMQELYWKGKIFKRDSEEYQELLNKLFQTVYDQCDNFKRALYATKSCVLTHSIGKRKETETVLTVQEFCGRLTKLRDFGKL